MRQIPFTAGGAQPGGETLKLKSNMSQPSHRQQKRPIPILKNKKPQIGGVGSGQPFLHADSQLWNDIGEYQLKAEGTLDGNTIKSITETNFFECKEVTNCEFIYE